MRKLALIIIAGLNIATASFAQRAQDFNADWKIGDKKVTLPRAWNEEYAFKVPIEKLPDAEVTYTKTFLVPKVWKGKKVFIEFEGARQAAEVFLNGTRIGLHFWSWGYGYLYDVNTYITVNGKVIDRQTTTTGFRKTAFRNGMTYLNDRVMMMHGYAQRTSNEWPGVGMSVPAWLSDYSNELMVLSGGNLVRWMHVCPWKQDIESCDRVGLIQAMPAGDAEKDVKGRHWEQRVELMRDAIIYNRNNPSILFYECGNKGISEEHQMEMKQLRDKYDPHGGRAIGCREMLNKATCAEYGGEMLYINKSAGKPVWAMEYCRDEALRRYWDDWSYPYHKHGDGPLYPLAASQPASSITIKLQGTASDSDKYGNIKEIAAPVANELDLFKAKDGDKVRSELRIVECDLLQWID